MWFITDDIVFVNLAEEVFVRFFFFPVKWSFYPYFHYVHFC